MAGLVDQGPRSFEPTKPIEPNRTAIDWFVSDTFDIDFIVKYRQNTNWMVIDKSGWTTWLEVNGLKVHAPEIICR